MHDVASPAPHALHWGWRSGARRSHWGRRVDRRYLITLSPPEVQSQPQRRPKVRNGDGGDGGDGGNAKGEECVGKRDQVGGRGQRLSVYRYHSVKGGYQSDQARQSRPHHMTGAPECHLARRRPLTLAPDLGMIRLLGRRQAYSRSAFGVRPHPAPRPARGHKP